ncbi:MAG: hypothetical protein M1833_004450 [Piccolia ochrophora]|nr:MAG: hypothetical protein M1833_004450 [Piccolia ochrophora]
MAGSEEDPSRLGRLQSIGGFSVTDPPKFDLDSYIANYKGRTRFDRLVLIGGTSSHLSHDALKGAVAEAKRGKDVGRYQIAIDMILRVAPEDPDATPDLEWIATTNSRVKAETEKLESELKGYKNNLIKESIRMGNEDLGSHYHSIGDLPSSYKAYARMREFCGSPKHISEMCQKLIWVSIEQGNWLAVQSNALKVRNLQLSPADVDETLPKLSAATGLAQLASKFYADAAESFLYTNPSLGSSFTNVLTPNDIAVYGGLCALASMDRGQLQKEVLDNTSFRNFLELEPHIRRAIGAFCAGKYSTCLGILEAYRADYLLDLHLARHVPDLYAAVRAKSIVQYFIPFSRVTLASMATAFATSEAAIENELIGMIERGQLDARIDTQNRLLTTTSSNLRASVHHDALRTAHSYERTARQRLMRMNIAAAGLDVKPPPHKGPGSKEGDYGMAGGLLAGKGPGGSMGSGGSGGAGAGVVDVGGPGGLRSGLRY